MTQSIAIMILASPYGQGSCQTALSYAKAVVAKGYTIEQLFFYHDGVHVASNLNITSQDENNLAESWQSFIRDNNIPAAACIASALKRGILNDAEAKRYEKSSSNIDDSIEIAGLGTWVTAINKADKSIVFGN